MDKNITIAIMGGTGDLGSGLAKMWVKAGYRIIIGSRNPDGATDLINVLGESTTAAANVDAARQADVIVVAVPFASHVDTLEQIKPFVQGKIVIYAVVPLVPPRITTVQLPAEGSAAQIAQKVLGEDVRVVSAFHNVGAAKLHKGERVDCDVLVFGNDKPARELTISLAEHVAQRALDAGVLANSAAAEALTPILIGLNKRYKALGAGIRITGLPSERTNPDADKQSAM